MIFLAVNAVYIVEAILVSVAFLLVVSGIRYNDEDE